MKGTALGFGTVVLVGLFYVPPFCFSFGQSSADESLSVDDVPPATAAAMQQWREMRFGLFVHWGPVSLKGTEIGWSRQGPRRGRARGGTGTVPMEEYDNLYKQFNPVQFDADQWVRVAKNAGMRYLVFTSKHHDGFSNFDTNQTDYKITAPASPYGKDICRQLADACHRSDIALGWYYSPRDWYHKDFATDRHDKYLTFYMEQLRSCAPTMGRLISCGSMVSTARGRCGETHRLSRFA